MRTLKNVLEGILGNVDDVLAAGKDAIAQEANIDTLPTVKDFEKGIYNSKWHQALWYCPNVIKKYRSKYPDMVPTEVDSIMIVLDAGYSRVVDCNIYFTKKTQFGLHKLKTIVGWNDGFVGANLRKYKQMAIDILTKLAKNPDKMDKVMKWADEYNTAWTKFRNSDNDDDYALTLKIRQKSLLNDL